jgi:hypothetical protein
LRQQRDSGYNNANEIKGFSMKQVHRPRRSPMRSLAMATLTALAVLAASRCGRDDKKKKDDTPTTDGAGAAHVPSDWDGQSDWAGSALKVVDE